MCLVLLALDSVPGYPVVLAANRDERHERAAEPLHWWPDDPGIAGGRDAVAGGTWLGVCRDGRFAAVLNAPGQPPPAGAASRGELVPRFLAAREPERALHAIEASAAAYAGFHFVGGGPGCAWYLGARGKDVARLGGGVHGIDNAGLDVDDPRLRRARRGFAAAAAAGDTEPLLALLADTGDPGEGAGDCRPVFVRDAWFGTRCSTVLRIADGGGIELVERRFGPDGASIGDTRLAWTVAAVAAGNR